MTRAAGGLARARGHPSRTARCQRRDPRSFTGAAAPGAWAGLTADQLRRIMPNVGAHADVYAAPLNAAMNAHGITTREQQAAFLGRIAGETGDLHRLVENMNYTHAGRIARALSVLGDH